MKKLTANVPNTLPDLSIDYTGRTQVEEALRVLSKRQEAILAAVPDILIQVDNDKVITWANPAGVKFYGEDVIGKEVSFFFEGEQNTYEIVEPLFDGSDDVIYVESWQRRKDGEKRLLAWHCRSLKDTKGNVTGALSSGQDITARRQAEKELHLLSDTQKQIAQQENLAETFKLVGIDVQELIGDGYVGISWLDEQEQVMKIIGLYGFGGLYSSLVRRFKVDPTKLTYPLKDLTAYELRLFRSGSLEKFEKGLYQLMMRKIPKPICQASEKALKITGIYTMGFILHDLHLGVISILAKRDITPFKESIETIVNQATIVMYRIKAETSLRTSEANLRLVTDNMQDLVIRTDLEGLIQYASPSNKTILGYELESLLGKSIYDFMHPEDIDRVREFTLASLQAQKAGKQELRYRHADGHYIWLESTGAIIFDEGGLPTGAIFSSRDITERKRAENKLEDERILLRTLIDSLPDRIYVMDVQGRKLLSNLADWKASGGKRMEDVIGKTDLDTYPPELAADYWALDKAVIDSGISILNREEPGLDAQGNPVWVLSSKVALRDLQGKVAGLVGIGHDITERKRTEAELQSLLEMMQGLAITEDLPDLLELIRQSLAKVIYAENFFVVFKNKNTGLFEEVFAVDKYDPAMPPSKLERSITSYVFRIGEPLLLTQAKMEELVARGEVELVGTQPAIWLGAPLKTRNETIGVIAVQNYEDPDCYSEGDKEFLAFVGAQVSLVIERKRAEQDLQESENRLRTITEGTQALLVSVDANGHFIYVNEAMAKIFGFANPLDLVGKPYLHFIHSEDRQQVLDSFIKQVNTRQPSNLQELRIIDKSGKVKWFSFLSTLVINAGQVVGQSGVAVEITERKRAEEEIKTQLEELQRWQNVTLGRESRILDLKREVNGLLDKAGQPPRYASPG